MTFDPTRLTQARDGFKLLAALCFNDLELTPYQIDCAVEMFRLWAMDAELVEQHLRRVA